MIRVSVSSPNEHSLLPLASALDEPLSSTGVAFVEPNNAAPPWSAIDKRLPRSRNVFLKFGRPISVATVVADIPNTPPHPLPKPLLMTRTWERPPLKTSPVKVESPRPGAKYDVDRFNGVAFDKSVILIHPGVFCTLLEHCLLGCAILCAVYYYGGYVIVPVGALHTSECANDSHGAIARRCTHCTSISANEVIQAAQCRCSFRLGGCIGSLSAGVVVI